jgi:RNA-directed DNA polymerase
MCTPTPAGTPQGGSWAPLLALSALHGREEAITHVSPEARGIAYADDGLGLHPDRAVLDHCQQRLTAWLAGIGLPRNVNTTRINHTWAGDQLGLDFLGWPIRPYRVGTHQSGRGPRGRPSLGYHTLITPAKAHIQTPLAELGRVMRVGPTWPQAALIHQLNPTRRGGANSYRTWVCQATLGRWERLTWVQLRAWARRRHPNTSARWVATRSWHRPASGQVLATPPTRPRQTSLASHRATASLRHANIAGNRSPYDGEWVYGSQRRGPYPTVRPRLAPLIKHQGGRCTSCQRCFHHADQLEIDHSNGHRRDARDVNLQAFHGPCHDAKTREQGDHLPVGSRDKVSAH